MLLSHYVEYCWIMLGMHLLVAKHNAVAGYISAGMIVVLSIVKIFG